MRIECGLKSAFRSPYSAIRSPQSAIFVCAVVLSVAQTSLPPLPQLALQTYAAAARTAIARAHREAAVVYQQFLQENPEERAAMEVWESAPLVSEIEPKTP